jgi:NADH-quinone oxidoreductase subunit G
MINLTINGLDVSVAKGSTVLEAARGVGINIPTLCYMELDCFDIKTPGGSCRLCVVEIEGRPNLAPSCCIEATDGMVVKTNSIRAINARRTVLDLILSDHPKDCLNCNKNMNCELQQLAADFGLTKVLYSGEESTYDIDLASESIVRDLNKCIMCRRCETACTTMQTVGVLSGIGRGFEAAVGPANERPLNDTKCTFCGQCVTACPTGALTEMDRTYNVWAAINDPSKHVVVQTAPAVRVAVGEEFNMAPGSIATGKLVTALKRMGFDGVFDTDFAADVTIMEETTELIERVTKGENLPILTSCCPGWVKFFEHQYPELCNIPSSAKSPQQMFGALAKSYYAEKKGIDPKDIVVVSVMPCLAKKYEAAREELRNNKEQRDVDIVISTREIASMFKEAGIKFNALPDSSFDNPLGESTGAAVIFGTTGGVLEAALRTAADWISGQTLENIDFREVRGMEGIREAEVNVGGIQVKAAIASGLGNARKLLDKIKAGKADYHAIEIMACPGGCINGGGQPYIHGDCSIIEKRRDAIYSDDRNSTIRKSHENPSIKKLYSEFLGKPGSHKAHELLHTSYTPRKNV